MIDLEDLLMFLLSLNYNSSESEFLFHYFSSIELAELTKYSLTKNFIIYTNKKLELTNIGIEEIKKIKKLLNRKYIDGNIAFLNKYKIKKLKITDIYIPKKK